MADLSSIEGLSVDPTGERFQAGKRDGFTDWWEVRHYWPKHADKAYAQGYAFGWEMASDPLHEDGYDPHLAPTLKPSRRR